MTITLKHDKSTKQYEKYTSSDHQTICSIYIPKEEFHNARVPASIPIEIRLDQPAT